MIAPVGQACWQGAVTQCLQTSLIMSHRPCVGSLLGSPVVARSPDRATSPSVPWSGDHATTGVGSLLGNSSRESFWPDGEGPGAPSPGNCSMNFTCRQEVADSSPVLS